MGGTVRSGKSGDGGTALLHEIDLSQSESALNKSMDLLRHMYNESPAGGGGWYHLLDTVPPGATATAVALLTFHVAGESPPHLEDALNFLRVRQIKDEDPKVDGGWWTNTSKDKPVVEATAWVVRCLAALRCDDQPTTPDLSRAVSWLRNNQDRSGGWGSFHGCPPRVWLTCLALRALLEAAPQDPAVDKGVAWLIEQQLPSGGWAPEPRQNQARVAHTASALTTLAKAGVDPASEKVAKGFDWLLANLDTSALVEIGNREERSNVLILRTDKGEEYWLPPSLTHYALPVATTALMHHPRFQSIDVAGKLAQSFDTIVTEQCQDGSWPNSMSTHITLWGVWPCVEALASLRSVRLARAGDQIVWMEGAIVIRQKDGKNLPIEKVLRPLLPRRRWAGSLRWLRRHWAWVSLALFVAGGAVGLATQLIQLTEFAFGLILPIVLLVLQRFIDRKRQ